ncbi:MAG TPA: ABC transporter ATP-binding protein [Acidimicrobiia bacterium]
MRDTNPPLAVTTSKLTKAYGPDAGVFDLDIEIEPGTIFGFIGPSGSGKTTTVRLMTGVIAPDSGEVAVLGQSPMLFSKDTRARIGYLAQELILYPDLTLRQNLNFASSLYGILPRRKRTDRLVEFMELNGAIDRLPQDVSGGEKKRAMLAGTLIHDPELLFLDEPTAGIDPVLRRKFWDRFNELASDGKTLVVTTQYVGEAAYCDYVAVLARGRVLTIDTPDGLRKQAFGGETIEVVFARPLSIDDIASLRAIFDQVDWMDSDRLRILVDESESATASVSAWAEERGLELTRNENYLPPFDDVFVELVSELDQDSEEAPDPR